LLNERWPRIEVVFVSKPFDEIGWRFFRLPVIDQIIFVEARILYRDAVNLMQSPNRLRRAIRDMSCLLWKLPSGSPRTSRKDRLPGQARQ
jgi:hypothetical protein